MPFYLLVILAPKVAFLNEKGEIIVRRTVRLVCDAASSRTNSVDGGQVAAASKTGNAELESVDGEAVESDETEMTEINIRGFILSELDKMFGEYLICARPTLVEDESGNSLQAMCICERDGVDQVMARLAYYGVGNIVGSINVLSLESSKFFRSPKPITPSASNVTEVNQMVDIESGHLDANALEANGKTDLDVVAAAAAAAAEEAEQTQRKKTLIGEVASQIRVEQVVESIQVFTLSLFQMQLNKMIGYEWFIFGV